MIAQTVMVESGLGAWLWFKAAAAGKDAHNVMYKVQIKNSPHQTMYKEPKDVTQFRSCGCKALLNMNKDLQEKRKNTARAIEQSI